PVPAHRRLREAHSCAPGLSAGIGQGWSIRLCLTGAVRGQEQAERESVTFYKLTRESAMFLRLFSLCTLLCVMPACANEAIVDCANASSTPEIDDCAKLELDEAERELKQACQNLVKQLSQPDTETDNFTELRQSLKEAQRAWTKFREMDCDTQFLLYGSGT